MTAFFTWMFVCNLVMFYDWSECVMNVHGTTKTFLVPKDSDSDPFVVVVVVSSRAFAHVPVCHVVTQ